MSATPATADLRPLRFVRRVLDQVERALRPDRPGGEALDPPAPAPADDAPVPGRPDDDLDSTTTRELLVPTSDEPAAARASRQAQAYLERRRRKLARTFDAPR
jgi:hypothetical protein